MHEPTREHCLYLCYRAQQLYTALSESEKLFKHISEIIYDQDEFDQIRESSELSEEQKGFLKHRFILLKRI